MPQQGDFFSRPANDGVRYILTTDVRKRHELSAILTEEVLNEIFDQKILTAALLCQVKDKHEAWAARLVLSTLTAIRDDIKRRMT